MFIALFLLWVIFNGRLTLEIAVLGLVISGAIFLFICKFMDYSIRKEKIFMVLVPGMIKYFFILLWEIVKANFQTAGFVLNQKIEVEPVIIHFTAPLESKFLQVVLANSITLTPGTITVNIEKNEFTVHCLDSTLADGIEDSIFVRELVKAEERIRKIK